MRRRPRHRRTNRQGDTLLNTPDTRRRPKTGRTPPHNLVAERSLLGAMLLSRQAIAAASEYCEADDFYAPAHPHIYTAILHLAAAGEPVDPVTVSEHLDNQGLLDQVGGIPYLVELLSDCPATTSAASYARIVAEHAELRRHIGFAGEVAELAYAGRLDDARNLIADTAERVTSRCLLRFENVASVVRGEEPDLLPTILWRSDGACLLYPGLSHSFAGEPTAGKTLIALAAAAQLLERGGRAAMIDYEGNRRVVGGRLRAMGADPDAVAERFHYLRPPTAFDPALSAELGRLLAEAAADLVIIDGVARGIARQGGNEDTAADVLAWIDLVVRPATETGAAALMLDHVAKSRDGRGRWARGSGAKLGEIEGAAYSVDAVQPWSRTRPGYAHLRLDKDREGVLGTEGSVVAVVRFTPTAGGVAFAVDPPDSETTECEAAILEVLRSRPSASQKQLLDELRDLRHARHLSSFRDSTVLETLENLEVSRRVIAIKSGPRGAIQYEVSER